MNSNEPSHQQWIRDVVAEFEPPLLRYAASLLHDAERARDVVQDTFIKLCAQQRAQLQGHLAEWLFTVCRNRARDLMRKEHRTAPLSNSDLDQRAGPDDSPMTRVQHDDDVQETLAALNALPSDQREVLRLKFQKDLSYKEISRVTGHSVSHVGVLIHTGIKTLRRRLAPSQSQPSSTSARSTV